ncbi:hypothetical protein LTR94_025145 [Friedmanniomyces endolithicus]|nr:hypothetical protein LTR94_025145 [Friedmanniomyces endolithicus]
MSPEAFGACVLWFAVAYVLASVQNAVSVAHLQVLPAAPGDDPARISVERIMLAATLVFLLLVLIGTALSLALLGQGGAYGVWTAVLFVPAYLLQQYARLTCFSRGEAQRATLQTGCVLIVAVLFLALGTLVFRPLGAVHVLGLMGAAYGVVGLAGLWRASAGLRTGLIKALPDYLGYCRQSGWLFVGVSSTEILARFYVFAVGAALGPAALAALSFTQTFLRPIPLLASSWGMAARNDLAARRDAQNWSAYVKLLAFSGLGGVVVCLIWSALVWGGWPWLTAWVFAGKYADVRWMTALWGVSVALAFVQVVISTGLQILKAFKALAIANAVACLVAAVGVIWGVNTLGAGGAIVGTAAGQAFEAIAMGAVLLVLIGRLRRG